MEVTSQLFRALASPARLRILRVIAVLGEQNVGQLADATGTSLCDVSYHLHLLSLCGVVWRRRSASFVYYRLAEEPSNDVTRAAVSLLKGIFAYVAELKPSLVAKADQSQSAVHSDEALVQYFTAFTHPRRLQIIRLLATEEAAGLRAMGEALGMSYPACSRHVENLVQRGLVRRARIEGILACDLEATDEDSPFLGLWRAVVRKLSRGKDNSIL